MDRTVQHLRLAIGTLDHQGAGAPTIEIEALCSAELRQERGQFRQAHPEAVTRLAAIDHQHQQVAAVTGDAHRRAGVERRGVGARGT